MFAGNTCLVVVPARGGSKGIPLKNLQEVGGKPLVARVDDVLRELPWVDSAVVSTDHEEIARVAEAAGIAAILRSSPTVLIQSLTAGAKNSGLLSYLKKAGLACVAHPHHERQQIMVQGEIDGVELADFHEVCRSIKCRNIGVDRSRP